MVSKTTGKITVCKRPKYSCYSEYKFCFDFDYKLYVDGYVFNLDRKNLEVSKIPRKVINGYILNVTERITHYLFINKEEAKEYAKSIIQENINKLNLQLALTNNL